MRSRLLSITAAVLIGVVGTAILLTYVRAAQGAAVAGEQTVTAYVVREAIPAGTAVDEVAALVTTTEVPLTLANDQQVRDLTAHGGTVTTVDLTAGELLMTGRLATPEQLESAGKVDVPDDHQQVTFSLDPQRVVGGQITAGDSVGVFVSLEGGGDDGPRTRLVLDEALVTNVQRDDSPPEPADGEPPASGPPPANNLLVTLALQGDDATKAVFGAEFGRLWLSAQDPDTSKSKTTTVQTTESIYR